LEESKPIAAPRPAEKGGGRLPIDRDGVPFVAIPALAALLLFWVSIPLSLAAALLAGFCIFFFRDPERRCDGPAAAVAAPADGRVVSVHQQAGRPTLAIFLSIFDVHVNRAPCAGRVEQVTHKKGEFLLAWKAEASEANEQTRIELATERGPVEVRQIAGVLARRIVCRVAPGDALARSDRLGMIRFGSRVELTLPRGSRIVVAVGDTVRAGRTVVAELAAAGPERA